MRGTTGGILLFFVLTAPTLLDARAPAPLPRRPLPPNGSTAEADALLAEAHPNEAAALRKLPYRFVLRFPPEENGKSLVFAVAAEEMKFSEGGMRVTFVGATFAASYATAGEKKGKRGWRTRRPTDVEIKYETPVTSVAGFLTAKATVIQLTNDAQLAWD